VKFAKNGMKASASTGAASSAGRGRFSSVNRSVNACQSAAMPMPAQTPQSEKLTMKK
jgi:hypothetical protein